MKQKTEDINLRKDIYYMKIKFCGAATGVTGSCHLISTEKHKILLDCGQFQGGVAEEALNRDPFPFDPAEIECVVVSHAHIDHIGRLPLLVKQGFTGKIYCTHATADLLNVMLEDSAHIHEQDAEWQNRKGMRAGLPAVEPLYTEKDAKNAEKLVKPVLYDTLVTLNDQMKIVFNDAGHILGSAIIELWVEENDTTKKLVFSGDLGMTDRPILNDPTIIHKADYLIMETTYGNRLHEENATSINRLLDIIVETTGRGGNVVIPSFAVGRTQEIIFELNRIYDGNSRYKDYLKNVHVYVDSPMASQATEIFKNNAQVYDEEMREFIMRGDHPLDFKNLHFTESTQESKMINSDPRPKIIISASGMCTAGRIRHHLKHNLYNPKSSIVFVGYQAAGTLGRILLEGVKKVKLFGETIAVRAQIHNLDGFSGHADRDALFDWLSGFTYKPHDIFLVHGETDAKRDFAAYVKEHKGWDCIAVEGYDEYELSDETVLSRADDNKSDETELNVSDEDNSAVSEFTSDEEMDELLLRLGDISGVFSSVVSNTASVVESSISADKLAKIKNLVADLEKDVMNLGSALTEEDRADDDELYLDGKTDKKNKVHVSKYKKDSN